MNPISSFELLFFAVFGQTTTEQTQTDKILNLPTRSQPLWTDVLFKVVFGIYMLVSVVVLINLLIAMMSDTYQRIQVSKSISRILKFGTLNLFLTKFWDIFIILDQKF